MFYAYLVSTVESDILHFWVVQRGRNAWLLEMVVRCNRTIILVSAVPEITSANGCMAISVLFEPCLRFSLHKSSRIHHLFLIIFLYLCYKAQNCSITVLPLKEVPWGQSAIQTIDNVVQEQEKVLDSGKTSFLQGTFYLCCNTGN